LGAQPQGRLLVDSRPRRARHATAIWLIPIDREFKASLVVGHVLAASELFLLYWLLGRLGRSDESRLTDL